MFPRSKVAEEIAFEAKVAEIQAKANSLLELSDEFRPSGASTRAATRTLPAIPEHTSSGTFFRKSSKLPKPQDVERLKTELDKLCAEAYLIFLQTDDPGKKMGQYEALINRLPLNELGKDAMLGYPNAIGNIVLKLTESGEKPLSNNDNPFLAQFLDACARAHKTEERGESLTTGETDIIKSLRDCYIASEKYLNCLPDDLPVREVRIANLEAVLVAQTSVQWQSAWKKIEAEIIASPPVPKKSELYQEGMISHAAIISNALKGVLVARKDLGEIALRVDEAKRGTPRR